MTSATASNRQLPPILIKFALAGVVALGVGVLSAVVAQTPTSTNRTADDTLALRVRQALADDPTLGPHKLSLLVNVLDGVAVIGGPVPDVKLTPVIESVAAGVTGVVRVKVSVWAAGQPAPNPLADRLGEKLSDKPKPPPAPVVTLTLPADPPSKPDPPTKADPPVKPDPRPTAGMTARPVAPPSVLQPPVVATERTSQAPHVRPPGAEPLEYTPIPATDLPTTPVLEPPAKPVFEPPAPAPAARAAPPRDAEPTAWKRDPRFAQLTVDVRNGTAVIGGRAKTRTAAWELAEEVRGWSGVDRVVVGQVEMVR